MVDKTPLYYPGTPVSGMDGEELSVYLHEELLKIADYFRNFNFFNVVRQSSAYTPRAFEIVLCTASLPLTLNTGAVDSDEIIIIPTSGTTTLIGTIHGSTSNSLTVGEVYHLRFYENENEWLLL